MNRRNFLQWIGGTAVGAALAPTLDLERILWVPGEKKIFLPPPARVILAGEEAVVRLFESVDPDALPKHSALFARQIHTAAGAVWVDANENVVTVRGRTVGAQEAARLRLMMFNPHNRRPTDAEMNDMVSRVISERVAAGWTDPVGEKPWHFPVVFERKILEGV